MKNMFFVILILTLLGLESYGDGLNPIKKRGEVGYTTKQVAEFACSDGKLPENFRRELLAIVNKGMVEAGETRVFTLNDIKLIFSFVEYRAITLPENYINSGVIPGTDTINFEPYPSCTEECGIFSYGNCHIILYKTYCMNLLKVSWEEIGADRSKNQNQNFNCRDTVIINITNITNIPRDTIINVINLNLPKPEPTPVVTIKNGKLRAWHIVVPLIGAGGLATYFIISEIRKNRYVPDPVIPDTGKPGGAPSTPDTGGPGGAPSTPDTTPDTGGPGGSPSTGG